MKRLGSTLAFCILYLSVAYGQVGLPFPGPGTPHTTVAYQGPGDLGIGSFDMWGSTARAYSAAFAATQGAIADLVDTATGAATCTMNVGTNGFANTSALVCAGNTLSVTTFCTVTHPAGCSVTKLYDQTGNTRHLVNVTLATMPTLSFSSPGSGSLPVMTGPNTSTLLRSAAAYTPSPTTNLTMTGVYIRTANFTTQGVVTGFNGGSAWIGPATSANKAQVTNGTEVDSAGTTIGADSVWHVLQGVASTTAASCALNVDGTDATGLTCGVTLLGGVALQIFRQAGGTQMNGSIGEVGYLAGTPNATNRGTYNTNAHGTSGYNF